MTRAEEAGLPPARAVAPDGAHEHEHVSPSATESCGHLPKLHRVPTAINPIALPFNEINPVGELEPGPRMYFVQYGVLNTSEIVADIPKSDFT